MSSALAGSVPRRVPSCERIANLARTPKSSPDIYRRFDGKLALNCFVIEGGELAVGDEVQLARGRACAESAVPAVVAE